MIAYYTVIPYIKAANHRRIYLYIYKRISGILVVRYQRTANRKKKIAIHNYTD